MRNADCVEERDDVYTQTLSITDLTSHVNSYYILQLIESDAGGRYHVFRKWGRTGSDRGGKKLTDHGNSKQSAKEEFCEVYLDKTGNRWADHANFVKKPGKFNVVDVDYSAGGDDPFDAAAASDAPSQSKLPQPIQDLMKIFFDISQIKKTLLSMEIDLDKMPLGKLSRKHIQSGYDVLTEIQNAIEEQPINEGKLLGLSNKFYTLIPHEGNPAILRDTEQIKAKIEMVETLLEIEVATKMLKQSKEAKTEGKDGADEAAPGESNDPIDVHYRQLKTDVSQQATGCENTNARGWLRRQAFAAFGPDLSHRFLFACLDAGGGQVE
jgi:predicted DNA-binding WGR domain protein